MSSKTSNRKDKIKSGIKKIGQKALKSNNIFFTFLRSIVSSQCASWVDLGLGFVLFSWLKFSPALATAIGAICGGIVNCIINYKFTFRADNVSRRAVAVKYSMVWVTSMLLNTFGTAGLYYLIEDQEWLTALGFKKDGYYAAARLFTSLMVSWFWNFPMQKYFVYSVRGIDKHITGVFDMVKTRVLRNGKQAEIDSDITKI